MKVDLLLIFEDNAILIDLTGILTYLCSERNEFLSLSLFIEQKGHPEAESTFSPFPANCLL